MLMLALWMVTDTHYDAERERKYDIDNAGRRGPAQYSTEKKRTAQHACMVSRVRYDIVDEGSQY